MSEQATRITVGAAPRDFDLEREQGKNRRQLTFKAGGETFRVKAFVSPEQMDSFKEGDEPDEPDSTGAKVYDRYIKNMLESEDVANWDKVRKEADPPLSLADIETICYWLIEVATGRPTERLSSSGRGPQASKDTSKEASRLQTT